MIQVKVDRTSKNLDASESGQG